LAEGVIKTVLLYLKESGSDKPKKVVISVGELQQIDMDAFTFALNELKKGSIIDDVEFEFVEEKAIFKCENCGFEWGMKDIEDKLTEDISEAIHFLPELSHGFISCPRCGSKDFDIVKGRGVKIGGIVL